MAPLAADEVVADLGQPAIRDRLEHRPAIAEEGTIGDPLDGPQAEPVGPVAVHRPPDPGDDAFAVLRGRVVRHRHRVAEDLEQVVRVVQGQSAKSQSVGGQHVHGSQDRAGRRVQSAAMTSHGAR